MTDLELAEEIRWRAQRLREYAASTEHPSGPFCVDTAHYMEQIIAALRRGPDRPPSDEMAMVPREPTEEMTRAVWRMCNPNLPEPVYFTGSASDVYYRSIYRAMLSAAEAEGRKS